MLPHDLVKTFSGDVLFDLGQVCAEFEGQYKKEANPEMFEQMALSLLSLARALLEKSEEQELAQLSIAKVELPGSSIENVNSIRKYFRAIQNTLRSVTLTKLVEKSTAEFSSLIQGEFSYSFTENEISRIQTLINELRELIATSEILKGNHISRLLRRLEKLQSELHKSVSDLDRFWGLVGDAGVALGKFGEDAKPLVDRIKEIAEIVWKAQQKSEGIEDQSSKLPLIEDQSDA